MIELFSYFKNSPSLSLIEYRQMGVETYHYGIVDRKTGYRGFGASKDRILAQTKSLFELIERTVFKMTDVGITSSGWAAHTELEIAKQNAMFELIERDAVLCSWLLKKPPEKIGFFNFRIFKEKFQILQFGFGKKFVVLGVIVSLNGKRMLLSTTASNISDGIKNLLIDSERAYLLLKQDSPIENIELSFHHKNFCGLSDKQLNWIYQGGEAIEYDNLNFLLDIFDTPLWNAEKAWVVQAKSNKLQNLFYSAKFKNYLNFNRLRSFKEFDLSNINSIPHPIL